MSLARIRTQIYTQNQYPKEYEILSKEDTG